VCENRNVLWPEEEEGGLKNTVLHPGLIHGGHVGPFGEDSEGHGVSTPVGINVGGIDKTFALVLHVGELLKRGPGFPGGGMAMVTKWSKEERRKGYMMRSHVVSLICTDGDSLRQA
jgi:hypothetical protein